MQNTLTIEWSLLLSVFIGPLCVLFLGIWLKRNFSIHRELVAALEKEKENAIVEWKQSVVSALRDITAELKVLAKSNTEQVTWEACEKREVKLRAEMIDIRNTCFDKTKQLRGEITEVRVAVLNHIDEHHGNGR